MLADETPEKPVSGKLGNTNALKSGRRSARPGTVLAVLGRRYTQAYRDVCRLRREVEAKLGGRAR